MGSTDKKRRKRTLTGKQQTALLELLAGHTITEAAERTGITRQTISGWVNQDDIFAAELANKRRYSAEVGMRDWGGSQCGGKRQLARRTLLRRAQRVHNRS
jgi:hypothetical protein